EIVQVLRDGRDWCATVRQSHSNHPSLLYFRSVGTGSGWPAALGALLDLALLIELWLELPEMRGLAVLLREDGTRMAVELGRLTRIAPRGQPEGIEAAAALRERLEAAGFRLRTD